MSRYPQRRMPPGDNVSPPQQQTTNFIGAEKLRMQDFARRLHDIRIARGMSQSDLARAVWGEKPDKGGRMVARNRDRVSQYEKGNSWPEPANLKKLADALNVTLKDLAPDITAATVDKEHPLLRMNTVSGHEKFTHLEVNVLLPLGVALQVASLVEKALEEAE